MTKKEIKTFWGTNKKKILIGTAAVVGSAIGYLVYKKLNVKDIGNAHLTPMILEDKKPLPSRTIPETEGFKILDIAEDINDGCVTWFDGCKLSDCGKLGEGLSKIERVGSDMVVTMVILAKDKLEL